MLTRNNDLERVKNIKLYTALFRETTQKVLEMANLKFSDKLIVQYIAGSSNLKFSSEEIANDGFHLSTWGQSVLAETVLQEIR